LYATLQKDLGYVDIFNLYGPTEATVYCTVKKLTFDSDVVDKVVSVGRDISNCHTIILDHNMQELPAIIKGEVYIGGVQLMHSYINDVDKTSEVLIEIGSKLYYKTGDIGFKDQVDDLYITGRMDDTIKVSGYRVNLSDIDSYISSIPLVDECATIAIFDEIKENILVAYIASKVKDKDSIYNELRKIMPQYQLPQEIVFIDDFPLNNSGKISKNQLIELHKENLHKVKTK
jgi:acyl-coenzyme A synthetase/AMP-(fatty) acid ligase